MSERKGTIRESTPERDAVWFLRGLALKEANAVDTQNEWSDLLNRVDDAVTQIISALPDPPPNPMACAWCQSGRHYNCRGVRRVDGDGPGQASAKCECAHTQP